MRPAAGHAARQHSAAVMVNLLGELWYEDGKGHGAYREPDWSVLHAVPGLRPHLYGSTTPPGAQDGHFVVIGDDAEDGAASARSPRVPRSASATSERRPMSDPGPDGAAASNPPRRPRSPRLLPCCARASSSACRPRRSRPAADAMTLGGEEIFAAKGRPADHPLIVHLPSAEHLPQWAAAIPKDALALARAFWPGPLTLILKRTPDVPDEVTGGRTRSACGCPPTRSRSPCCGPSTAGWPRPSANRFGRISPTTAAHVHEELGGRVAMILDGGACAVGIESTILDFSRDVPEILRPGAITPEDIARVIGRRPRVPGESVAETASAREGEVRRRVRTRGSLPLTPQPMQRSLLRASPRTRRPLRPAHRCAWSSPRCSPTRPPRWRARAASQCSPTPPPIRVTPA